MRIYITGPGGSGKSTLALKLWEKYRIPVIHLDEFLWNADGTENKNYKKLQWEAITQKDWIIEWASCSILEKVGDKIDFIVLLNPPPLGNVWRVFWRFVKERILNEKRIGFSFRNGLSIVFLIKTLFYRVRQLPRIRENIEKCRLQDKFLEISSMKDVFERVSEGIDNLPFWTTMKNLPL